MVGRSSVRRGVAAVLVLTALAAGCASEDDPPKAKPTPSPTGPTEVTFAVYGPPPVTDAYKEIAATYTARHPGTKIIVQTYASHDEAMAAFRSATAKGAPPDLFLMNHDDLAGLASADAVRRVDDLLAQREVDFGDGYTRNGLEAFSSDAALQCMPQDVSPLVVYYNPKLIELDKIAEPGRNPVAQENGGWSLEEFRRGRAAGSPPGRARPPHRARPRAGRAVRLVRRRRGRRRRRGAHHAHPVRRSVGERAGEAARAGARPGSDVQPARAAPAVGPRALQGRQAGHDPRLP